MKILIVAGTFPPYAPSSASRVNKLAKFLEQQGHDLRVLAPKLPDQDMSLTPEISMDKIIFTDYTRINSFPNRVKKSIKDLFSSNENPIVENHPQDIDPTIEDREDQGEESALSYYYRSITNIPDSMIGWYPAAIKAGRLLFSSWSPDVIFATAPPYTGLVVASRLSRMIETPWVADYRDLWNDESNDEYKTPRGRVNQFVEKRFLSNCDGLVTVTNSWVNNLENTYNIPVCLAMNGFDPDDFDSKNKNTLYPNHLTLLYAGEFYGDKRDPSKLFEALGKMGNKAKDIKVLFYTPDGFGEFNKKQKAIVEKYKLHDQIVAKKYIPQQDLLNIQLGVDVLLLLRWDDPRENGVIAGKLFEYIGAGKQILSVGSTTGEAADIIRDNGFGTVSNDVDNIIEYLEKCLVLKNKKKPLEYSSANRDTFARSIQFKEIEKMLINVSRRDDPKDYSS